MCRFEWTRVADGSFRRAPRSVCVPERGRSFGDQPVLYEATLKLLREAFGTPVERCAALRWQVPGAGPLAGGEEGSLRRGTIVSVRSDGGGPSRLPPTVTVLVPEEAGGLRATCVVIRSVEEAERLVAGLQRGRWEAVPGREAVGSAVSRHRGLAEGALGADAASGAWGGARG